MQFCFTIQYMIVLELKISFISVSNSQMKFMILLILLSLKNTPENVPLEYCLGSVSVISQSYVTNVIYT